jgi:hypothetical protein
VRDKMWKDGQNIEDALLLKQFANESSANI